MQDVAVEKQERAQRLVLGRSGNPTLDRQGAEKASDLGRAHLGGMALAVEEDVATDPPDVGFLGAPTAVAKAVRYGLQKPLETAILPLRREQGRGCGAPTNRVALGEDHSHGTRQDDGSRQNAARAG